MHVSLISDEKVEDLTQGKDYTVNDRQVTLAAPTGLKIKIFRVTTTKPLVGWADASVLRAADMTVQSTQLLHLAEETSDIAQDGGLSKDTADNIWDARYNKIKNLLDPTEPGDAVTLRYITANKDALINQLNATGDSQNTRLINTGNTQNASLVHAGNTQNARLNSTGDTQNARLVTTGDSYVSTMTTLKNTATDKATESTNQAALAKKWAVSDTSPDGGTDSKSAKTWAEAAKVSASNSASSASASASSATASQNSASSSASSASTATQKAMAAASSASAASTSASNAATSATNAKASETKAASSASAAANSADRAATFDPSSYYSKTEVDDKIKNNKPDLSSYYTKTEIDNKLSESSSLLEKVYPVGSIYMNASNSENPATLLGFGTWVQISAGRVLIGAGAASSGTTYNAGDTGGEESHTLSINEMPSHNHSGYTNTAGNHTHDIYKSNSSGDSSDSASARDGTYFFNSKKQTSSNGSHTHTLTINNTGGNNAHNNMQPYLVVYIFQRTA